MTILSPLNILCNLCRSKYFCHFIQTGEQRQYNMIMKPRLIVSTKHALTNEIALNCTRRSQGRTFGTYTFCVSFNISWNDYILITHDEIEKISDK